MNLGDQVQHFRARLLQDALSEATSAYWLRRARAFEAARPRPGDFTGQATLQDLVDQSQRLQRAADACRNAAKVALFQTHDPALCPIDPDDVWAALEEYAA